MTKTVGIVNTNAGNIASLVACFERLGYAPIMINEDVSNDFDILVIPGQGRFGTVMTHLRECGLDKTIMRHIEGNRTVIGICVGLQILFDESAESPDIKGLSVLSGKVEKLDSPKQPMVGWATLSSDFDLDREQVYFVNSYAVKAPANERSDTQSNNSAAIFATTTYGDTFIASIRHPDYPNVYGFQFHPEKSGVAGRRLLQKAIDNDFTKVMPESKMVSATSNSESQSNQLCPRVIPCLDVDNGRVVKGTQFVDIKDMGDPVELAEAYEKQGADEILYLDITATNENRGNALDTVKKVAERLSIPLTVGGGLRTVEDVEAFLGAGADKVAVNSSAVANPTLVRDIAQRFGSQALVVAIDAAQELDGNYRVYTHGGKQQTELDAIEWAARVAELGAGEILLTAKHRDGTGEGFDNSLMTQLARLPIQVIASGGAANAQHFIDTYRAGSDAALAAGMFHRGEITISELKQTLLKNNIQVRQC